MAGFMGEMDGGVGGWGLGAGSGDHMLAIYYFLTVALSLSISFISFRMASHTFRHLETSQHSFKCTSRLLSPIFNQW